MLNKQRDFLESCGVRFAATNDKVHFGVGKHSRIEFECPVEIRAGRYDVERIGAFTYIGGGDTIARNIASIGRYCAIAPNFFAGPVEHRVDCMSAHPIFEGNWRNKFPEVDAYYERNQEIVDRARKDHRDRKGDGARKVRIGNDVWIGENVFVRKGVSIGTGAVVAARSVVLNDIEPYTIVGGVPAKPIRKRFDERIVEALLATRWWDCRLEMLDGADFKDPERAVDIIRDNKSKVSNPYFEADIAVVEEDHSCDVIKA